MQSTLRVFTQVGVFPRWAIFGPLLAVAVSTRALALPGFPQDAEHPKGVVELFTSQGCQSCPPADRLLNSLANDSDMIALSFSVDYWDYTGWKDTLALPDFTARQKAYAATRGDDHVYTPQIVVDGRTDVVGSDEDAVQRAVAVNRGRDGALSIPMRFEQDKEALQDKGALEVEIGAAGSELLQPSAGVYLLRVARMRRVMIERGGNKGRNLIYTNVVRAIHRIGQWHGTPLKLKISEIKQPDEDFVILLQRGTLDTPGTILAAAKSPQS